VVMRYDESKPRKKTDRKSSERNNGK